VPSHYEDYVHRCGRTGRAGRKGTAVTFITPEQERYAPDLIRGLKQSNKKSIVPKELEAMAESFSAKRKAGTVEAKGGGFGGSGFKFDESEAVGAAEKAAAEKEKYGIQVRREEKEVFDEDGNLIIKMPEPGTVQAPALTGAAAAIQATINAAGSVVSAAAPPGLAPVAPAAPPAQVFASTGNALLDKAQAAIRQAGMGMGQVVQAGAAGTAMTTLAPADPVVACEALIQELMKKQALMNSITSNIAPGDEVAFAAALSKIQGGMGGTMGLPLGKVASQEIARLKAQNYALIINGQQNLGRAQEAAKVAREFQKEEGNEWRFEINDFPQQVRWKLTHRETMQQINDFTGAAATTRGTYVPPTRAALPGEDKLHLWVEAPSPMELAKAQGEIKRLVTDIMSDLAAKGKLEEQQGSAQGGRYQVV
jgi:ATP-dependent RNA helicase DDX46/PRP5